MKNLEAIVQAAGEAQQVRDVEQLRALAQEAEVLGTPEAQAYALSLQATALSQVGQFADAIPLLRRAVDQYRVLDAPQMLISNLGNLGINLRLHGEYHEALKIHQEEADHSREHGLQGALARALGNIATVYKDMGEYPDALEGYHQALDLCEQAGQRHGVAANTGNLGLTYYHLGEFPKALESYYKAIELYTELGSENEVAGLSGNVGNVFNKMRDFDEAVRWYARALEKHTQLGNRYGMGLQHQNLSSMYFEQGSTAEGAEHLARAKALYEEIDFVPGLRAAISSQALNEIHEGNTAEARRLLDSIPELGDPREVSVALMRIRGLLHRAEGDLSTASSLLTEALETAERTHQQIELGLITYELRELAYQQKDIEAYVRYNDRWLQHQAQIQGADVHRQLMAHEVERRSLEHRQELERHKAVLYSTLPPEIAERVLRGETINDLHEQAVVLFADIAEFTSHTSDMDPGDVIALLRNIFSSFDAICHQHDVVKVKTIGDSYLCFSYADTGDPTSDRSPARRIARVALMMLASRYLWPDGSPLQFRIGIHAGPVIAGIVGDERLQYDIWGDTVNTASRMESSGEPGRVQCSESFERSFAAAQDDAATRHPEERSDEGPLFTKRGTIEVKGKGPMTTYWLEGASTETEN